MDFAFPVDHRVNLKESKKKDKYRDHARELKNMEHESNGGFIKRIGTGTGGLRYKRTNGDHPNYSFIKMGQNTEMSPGDLRRLAVILIQPKNHQLTLVWKTLK